MVAGDTGRLGIIKRAKIVNTSPVIRYRDARKALVSALVRPERSRGILETASDALEQKAADAALSSTVRDDAEKSLEALACFPQLSNDLAGYTYREPSGHIPYLKISGVDVSVNLDVLIEHSARSKEYVGGLIFRLTKPEEEESEAARSKRRDMGLHAATLVRMQVAENFAGDRQAHPPLCMSVDVQNIECFKAPSQYRKRQKDLEAACTMIAAMWDRA